MSSIPHSLKIPQNYYNINLSMKLICIYNGKVLTGLAAMEQCAVLIEDGLISDVFSQKRFEQRKFNDSTRLIDADGSFIASGFIDTHIQGIGGYGTEEAKTESILEMSRLLANWGVTAFNPTIYADTPDRMLETIQKITTAMGKEEGARIMGLNLEGPFISPERLGVQKPETAQAVNIDLMEQFWKASDGRIVMRI